MEGIKIAVLVHGARGNLLGDDFAKQAVGVVGGMRMGGHGGDAKQCG